MKNSIIDSLGDALCESNNPAVFGLHIPLTDISPDPTQPRKFIEDEGEQAGLADLAESILAHGVIQPVAVRDAGRGKYMLVTGERRYRAAQIARDSGKVCEREGYDLAAIPAVIIEPRSDSDRLEMQLVENIAREDMNDADIADALEAIKKSGVSQRQLAARLGRSEAWVRQKLAFRDPALADALKRLGRPGLVPTPTAATRLVSWQKDAGGRERLFRHLKTLLDDDVDLTQALIKDLDAAYVAATGINDGLVDATSPEDFLQIPAFSQILRANPRVVDLLLSGKSVQSAIQAPAPAEPPPPRREASPAPGGVDYVALAEEGDAAFSDDSDLEVPDEDEAEVEGHGEPGSAIGDFTEAFLEEGIRALENSDMPLEVAETVDARGRVTVTVPEAIARAVCDKAGVAYRDAESVLTALEALVG